MQQSGMAREFQLLDVSLELGIFLSLTQDKPQQLQQVNLDMCQQYCWHKSKLIHTKRLGPGSGTGYDVCWWLLIPSLCRSLPLHWIYLLCWTSMHPMAHAPLTPTRVKIGLLNIYLKPLKILFLTWNSVLGEKVILLFCVTGFASWLSQGIANQCFTSLVSDGK